MLPLGTTAGSTTWSLALPNNPWLLGQQIFGQAIGIDPTANALGAVTSSGVALTIGAR